ncbi:TetR/AcrR family transcriptional regulator [Flavihumibacter sp. R14]|nr:TetR/AcrR family transcriptional regulator [Flavihumibacter soli]
MVEADKKRELIIEGAIKRFSHFGVNKTSMAEIAEDLSLSKPALYYYFPDKQNLILGVTGKIISEYLCDVEKNFEAYSNQEDALMNLIEIRRNFFQQYFMLHMEENYSDAYLRDNAFIQLMCTAKEKEVSILAGSLKKGIAKGELREIDTVRTAELLLDTLRGLRSCMRTEKMIFPDSSAFEDILNKQKEVARIFLYGIKNHSAHTAGIQ